MKTLGDYLEDLTCQYLKLIVEAIQNHEVDTDELITTYFNTLSRAHDDIAKIRSAVCGDDVPADLRGQLSDEDASRVFAGFAQAVVTGTLALETLVIMGVSAPTIVVQDMSTPKVRH